MARSDAGHIFAALEKMICTASSSFQVAECVLYVLFIVRYVRCYCTYQRLVVYLHRIRTGNRVSGVHDEREECGYKQVICSGIGRLSGVAFAVFL